MRKFYVASTLAVLLLSFTALTADAQWRRQAWYWNQPYSNYTYSTPGYYYPSTSYYYPTTTYTTPSYSYYYNPYATYNYPSTSYYYSTPGYYSGYYPQTYYGGWGRRWWWR